MVTRHTLRRRRPPRLPSRQPVRRLAQDHGCQLVITSDKNIPHQNTFSGRLIGSTGSSRSLSDLRFDLFTPIAQSPTLSSVTVTTTTKLIGDRFPRWASVQSPALDFADTPNFATGFPSAIPRISVTKSRLRCGRYFARSCGLLIGNFQRAEKSSPVYPPTSPA
jgi:hypothetical protein